MARLYDDAFRSFGLTHGQFSLLMVVEGLQPVSVGRAASELVMDRTTVTAIIKPLTRRGLLQMEASVNDQRLRQLSLTREGRALLARSAVAWKQVQAHVQNRRPDASLRGELRQLAHTAAPHRAKQLRGESK